MKSLIGGNVIRNRKLDEIVYIYKLVDPSSGTVGYVGQTKSTVQRLTAHLTESRQNKFQTAKGAWLAALLARGIQPQLIVIQECTAQSADQYERYWIFRLLVKGYPLTNDVKRLTEDTAPYPLRRRHVQPLVQSGLP